MEQQAIMETIAGQLYDVYCKEVGGKAYDGKSLPSWQDFRNDPSKRTQSDAWVKVAIAAKSYLS